VAQGGGGAGGGGLLDGSNGRDAMGEKANSVRAVACLLKQGFAYVVPGLS